MIDLLKNLGCCIIFFSLALANELKPLYKAKGEDVVLDPNYPAPFITSIEWKHGSNLAAHWFGGNDTCYKPFEDRCKLNYLTGALTITGLDGSESGIFSVEINDKKIVSQIQLFVISKVPKPTVSSQCDDDSTSCDLTCNGNTTGAEPVNCTWFTGDFEKGSGTELKITKETEGETFSCVLKNPVSSQRSDSFPNPITTGERNRLASIVTPIVVLAALAIVIGIIIYFIRKRRNGAERDTRAENTRMLPNGDPQPNTALSDVPLEVIVDTNHVQPPAGTQNEENISQNSGVTSNNQGPTSGEGEADGRGDGD